jgi:hypothetical protein
MTTPAETPPIPERNSPASLAGGCGVLNRLPDRAIDEAVRPFHAGIGSGDPLLKLLPKDLQQEKHETQQEFDGGHRLGGFCE